MREAAAHGYVKRVRSLCDAGVDKDRAGLDGGTPLHLAAQGGHLEVLRCLCNAGVDKDKSGQDGGTPLHLAATRCHLEVVRCLCDTGVDEDRAEDGDMDCGHAAQYWLCGVDGSPGVT